MSRTEESSVPRHLAAAGLLLMSGQVDAYAVLRLTGFLPVYMTGNTSKLGQRLAEADWTGLPPLGLLIGTFVLSTILAAVIGRAAGRWREALLLSLVAAALLAAAFWPEGYSVAERALPLAVAMGMVNQVMPDQPGATFITGTLVRLGQAVAALDLRGISMNLLRWVAFLAGATGGIVLEARLGPGALLVPAGMSALGAIGAMILASRSG